ncbi:MAG: 50S ribosomal protein L3 [Gammaproteobacteria bacterium]
MSIGLIGKKAGMSRVFQEDGTSIPVSVISVAGNFVASHKTVENDGYSSVLISKNYFRKATLNKAQQEFFKKVDLDPGYLVEFKTENLDQFPQGKHMDVSIFENITHVDVTGTSKGKGYAGVIKRHNFRMQDATHGNSLSHRAHGSTGQCQTPGRVWKGKKMSGQMGNVQKTVQSLELVKADLENNLLFVKGAIPGATGSLVRVIPAVKKAQS